ncbi:fungal-specific transcription factor domain-containing protein [Pseudoneurospora amorphoporcata]|uniref:Fungal-specific transcription factor domain-containing protein n=1 Tax=Pseudoneurospora amorphoporcata TaxID=241081 RepID=A0AAN6SJC8_9PEZI|nr:fungal-specific transcription factor domain-containing protein [Pseudoneurospora amorphoporcata]
MSTMSFNWGDADADLPSDSEATEEDLLDNPVLKVSRPVTACTRCRSAKIKCDGKLPACTSCVKFGRESECMPISERFIRGREPNYVRALEARVEKLEKQLHYARSHMSSQSQPGPGPHPATAPGPMDPRNDDDDWGPDRRDSLDNIRVNVARRAARLHGDQEIEQVIASLSSVTINPVSQEDHEKTRLSLATIILAASTNKFVPQSRSVGLPPYDKASKIVDFYMSSVHQLYPAFSRRIFNRLLEDIYRTSQRQFTSAEYWLFWMVLAIGSTAQSRQKDDSPYLDGLDFLACALPFAQEVLSPGNVKQIQSLLLMTIYSTYDPDHFDTWQVLGFTCRAILDQGPFADPPEHHGMSITDVKLRRRIFRSAYSLDRAISLAHARAFSFADDAIPSEVRDALADTPNKDLPTAEASTYLYRLRRLQSTWYQSLFQGSPSHPLPDSTAFIWRMCHDMHAWLSTLPVSLNASMRQMLELEMYYSHVFCISPGIRSPRLSTYGELLIFEYAISYINGLCGLADAPINTALYTFHDVLRLFFVGTQFAAILRSEAADILLFSPHTISHSASQQGGVAPLPLPRKRMSDTNTPLPNIDRAITALGQIGKLLEWYGARWEDALSLGETFQMYSQDLMETLRGKKQQMEQRQVQQGQMQRQAQGQRQGQELTRAQTQGPGGWEDQQQQFQHQHQQHQQHQRQQNSGPQHRPQPPMQQQTWPPGGYSLNNNNGR